MVRSRLPLPSLLGLFGALLMLSPELPGFVSNVPFTDPGVQEALAAAVEQYNQERTDSANYFKVLSLIKARYQTPACHFNVIHRNFLLTPAKLVTTTCG